MDLVVGARQIDRRIPEAEELLAAYRDDSGSEYLNYVPQTPSDSLVGEDLAVTTLINSRFTMAAFRSMAERGGTVQLSELADVGLEDTSDDERGELADLITTIASWPGLAASIATKVLHKKRPRLIPILDNQAIFGAYMNESWPDAPSSMESVTAWTRIKQALDWIAFDLARSENASAWPVLEAQEPTRSRIQLFDSIWWMHFRRLEPVGGSASASIEASPATAPAATEASHSLVTFVDDDSGYRTWIYANPSGYVVNTGRNVTPSYMVLHRAMCETITPTQGGVWTRGDYIKVCSLKQYDLDTWARSHGGRLSGCTFCNP